MTENPADAQYKFTWTGADGKVITNAIVAGWQPFRPISVTDCAGEKVATFYQTVSLMGGGAMSAMGMGAPPAGPESAAATYSYYFFDPSTATPGHPCVQAVTGSISPFLPTALRHCKRLGSMKPTDMKLPIYITNHDHAPVSNILAVGNTQVVNLQRTEPILSDVRVLVFFATAKAFLVAPDSKIEFKAHKSLIGLVSGHQSLPAWVYIGIFVGLCLFAGGCGAYFKFVHGDDSDMPGVHKSEEQRPLKSKKGVRVGP